MSDDWITKPLSVVNLLLDSKNPRIGRETLSRAPRDIIQHLFEHDKAMDVAHSIATRGYFPNEPLLAVKEDGKHIVVEGNRRLAALKALREPGLLEGAQGRQIERLSRKVKDLSSIARVPVTIAPSRRATDRQIAGRHVGTPVLAWQAENRASFILDKLEEGYDNDELLDELGFSIPDIQKARQTRAIADVARSLPLAPEVAAKLDSPRAKVFSTIERVIDSKVGREYLKVEPNAEHGVLISASKGDFVKAFSKLVSDIALGHESSRSLNTNENIKAYFDRWDSRDIPVKRRTAFSPSEIISGKSVASELPSTKSPSPSKKVKQISKTVLPRDFKVRFGTDRLVDIRQELVKLKREDFPKAGAVMLRVFFELAVIDYLQRINELPKIIEKLEKKGTQLPYGVPTMKQLAPEIVRVAKARLKKRTDATKVEKAVKYDEGAPFTLSDLHAFVHKATDVPSQRDIWQFWIRTEPLFRLMLEQDAEDLPG